MHAATPKDRTAVATPTFSVVIHGQGFRFTGADGLPLRGFEVTRIVEAETPEGAVAAAVARVAREWAVGEFASTGVTPRLQAGTVTALDEGLRRLAEDSVYSFRP